MSADALEAAAQLRRSWEKNADAWTGAVREKRIASRRAGTDAAVIEAVTRLGAKRVLDVGCGEGWLARALAAHGCDVVGIDASRPLIDAARALGGGRFETMAYDDLDAHAATLGAPFDAVVCNFALLADDTMPLLARLRVLLGNNGRLVIQTVHPWIANGDARYEDGWRVEDFAAFGGAFAEPMPWFFRTMASWITAIAGAGFAIERLDEPVDAASGRPLSIVITAAPVR